MDKITIGDIITKLNPEIIYKEYIINVKDNKLINSNKSIEEYVSLINESNIEINIETIDELNTVLFREDESISTTSLLYMNFKENKTDKIYFYSFQGFSDTFIRNYKNTYAYSYLKFLLDGFLKEGTINNNIDDYLTIKTREYIEYIVRTISVRKNKRVNPVKSNISNLFDEINYISTLTYEGISVSAKLAICNETLINKFTKCFIKLDNPIYFGDYRKIRKLLEMSDKHTYLIGDSEKVYGLGKFANFKNFPSDILIFIFDFIGKFEYKINTLSIINSTVKEDKNADKEIIKWSSEECNIVNIKYGKPDLRESKYCETMLEQALEEIFPEFSKENNSKKLDTIKKVINYAINQKHGTAVVITKPDIAESEVTLLEEQSIKIKKIDIGAADCYLESIISKITNIDGAIYIDTEASCHAIGVILDGLAKKDFGDSSRGSRYNSAIKYSMKENLQNKCIVVVISEDGMVNIVLNGKDYKEHIVIKRKRQINELLSEACNLFNQRKYEKALEKVIKVIELDNKNAPAFAARASIEERKGNVETSLYYYDKTIKLAPLNAQYLNNKGTALDKLERYEEALECFEKATNLKPDNPRYLNNKGTALGKLERYEEALECFEKAINLKPDSSQYLNNKGTALSKLERYEEALECFEKAIDLEPDNSQILSNKEIVLKRFK